MLHLLDRPWARLNEGTRPLTDGAKIKGGACWIVSDEHRDVRIGERAEKGMEEPWLGLGVVSPPVPLRRTHQLQVLAGETKLRLDASEWPSRPQEDHAPENNEEQRAKMLLDRVKSVWARLRDVEGALEDPATMWHRLRALWLDDAAPPDPEMDIIVEQARVMPRELDLLRRAPRRILRRVHQMVPLVRVQEVDRKSMTWLIRQPGKTIAERAGDQQRVLAVAREESFDTLENRVVRSYAHMAETVARDYRDRYGNGARTPRVGHVVRFGGRCRTLARDLRARGVGEAGADAIPNFVLQNDARYHAVWTAWQELLMRGRILDELWQWQARSWEEFCALVVIIALQSRPGARLVAVSPIVFREEQKAGCWLTHVNPLAVLFLPDAGVTVEVTYRRAHPGAVLGPFGAAIWLRVGRIHSEAFLSRWAIWPLWHAYGGLVPGEGEEIATLLPHGRAEFVAGGITLRPVADGLAAEEWRGPRSACFTLGVAGASLQKGIELLGHYLDRGVLRRTV